MLKVFQRLKELVKGLIKPSSESLIQKDLQNDPINVVLEKRIADCYAYAKKCQLIISVSEFSDTFYLTDRQKRRLQDRRILALWEAHILRLMYEQEKKKSINR